MVHIVPSKHDTQAGESKASPPHVFAETVCSASMRTEARNEALLQRASLNGVPLFAGIDATSLGEIASLMKPCTFRKGALIGGPHSRDSRFHIITRGGVELLTEAPDKHTISIGKAGPGSYFGENEVLSNNRDLLEVRAVTNVETLALDRTKFRELVKRKPEAALEITRVLTERINSAHIALERHASQNVNQLHDEGMSRGEKIADGIASGMGSWKFIIAQSVIIGAWIAANVTGFVCHWDAYPFIFLNLAMSFQAAYAAPIIMMSQNRQAQKDRISADVDHEVNLKCERNVDTALEKLDKLEKEVRKLSRNEAPRLRRKAAVP